MLVAHANVQVEGQRFERGDTVNDPKLEEKIASMPHLAHLFTKPHTFEGPASAPRVSAGPQA